MLDTRTQLKERLRQLRVRLDGICTDEASGAANRFLMQDLLRLGNAVNEASRMAQKLAEQETDRA